MNCEFRLKRVSRNKATRLYKGKGVRSPHGRGWRKESQATAGRLAKGFFNGRLESLKFKDLSDMWVLIWVSLTDGFERISYVTLGKKMWG
jgi:hypothetical protein